MEKNAKTPEINPDSPFSILANLKNKWVKRQH